MVYRLGQRYHDRFFRADTGHPAVFGCPGILSTFAQYVHHGMVPNMFPDDGQDPLYNTADASLWYFYAVDAYLKVTGQPSDYDYIQRRIYPVLCEIIHAYAHGTDFSIYMDDDALIHAGSGLDQVTWMDVRVGDWVATRVTENR